MGSSSGDDYSVPPQQPAPPGNLISPPETGWQGMNFLGSGTTTVADIDRMQPQFAAMSAPPAAAGAGAAANPAQPPAPIDPEVKRAALARVMQQMGKRPGTYSMMGPDEMPPRGGFNGQGNRSDWGGSVAGGRM